MHYILSKFQSHYTDLDLFGHKVDLYINGKRKVKSKVGATFSLLLIGLIFYFFLINWTSWANLENLQTISSAKSLSVTELLLRNESYAYTFDFSNFNVYFVLSATFPNGSQINYEELERYLNQSFIFTDQNNYGQELEFVKCMLKKQRIFLEQDYSDLTQTPNKTSSWSICLGQALPMGLYTDIEQLMINQSVISYYVSKCQNSTENNNFCASEAEIEDIMQYVQVQASIPKTVYDFNNPFKPRIRSYDYQYYHLDLGLMKYITGQLAPVYLETDHGMVYDEYILDSVDFNLESISLETMLRKNENVMFRYDLLFGLMQQTYYRRNLKIYIFMANFGGVVNILFILGKLIGHFYNNSVIRHKLINVAFKNLEEKRDLFEFSPLKKNKLYSEARKSVLEYLDMKNIIKRLQDIDKLKIILFDKYQRKLFESIPKPGIGGKELRNGLSMLKMKNITGIRKYSNKEVLKTDMSYINLQKPMNQRLVDLISSIEKNQSQEKSSYFLFFFWLFYLK